MKPKYFAIFSVFTLLLSSWVSPAFSADPQAPPQVWAQTFTQKTLTTNASQVLAANTDRLELFIQNNGDEYVQLKFGSTFAASTTREGIHINPGSTFSGPWTGAVWMKSSGASTLVTVIEGVK